MSTAIPARLEFQCGHAALVSLPRIKGESPAQRNARIAHEKSAAQARSCDFCAARVELVVEAEPPQPPPPPPSAVVPSPPPEPRPARPAREKRTLTSKLDATTEPLQRYTVHYRVDRVLTATDIRDALRRAETLGAAELLAISRVS
jgi:hypothetical protein